MQKNSTDMYNFQTGIEKPWNTQKYLVNQREVKKGEKINI